MVLISEVRYLLLESVQHAQIPITNFGVIHVKRFKLAPQWLSLICLEQHIAAFVKTPGSLNGMYK